MKFVEYLLKCDLFVLAKFSNEMFLVELLSNGTVGMRDETIVNPERIFKIKTNEVIFLVTFSYN